MADLPWSPDPNTYQQIKDLLSSALTPTRESQVRVTAAIEDLRNNQPDFAGYLLQCFAQGQVIAGVMLMAHLRDRYDTVPRHVLHHTRQTIFPLLSAPSQDIRRQAVSVVSTLIVMDYEAWPQGIAQLMQLMNSNDPAEMEAAFRACTRLTEDMPLQLESATIEGAKPIDVLIPGWIQAAVYTDPVVRENALQALYNMAELPSATLNTHMDTFVATLFQLATDDHPIVRKYVCKCITVLTNTHFDKLHPHLDGMVDYMLYAMQDANELINIEACEFWLEFAENEAINVCLQTYLPKLIPVLLKTMVYTEEDLELLGSEEDDADVPDRPEDIAPHHVGGAMRTNEHVEESHDAQGRSRAAGDTRFNQADDDDYDSEDELDDEDLEEQAAEWNLRKCSAAALDVLAVNFGNATLEPLLPLLRERLFSTDWLQLEVGILALGAVAEGAYTGIEPHLSTLIPMLLNSLHDRHSLVRSITCWTLGRYGKWVVGDGSEEHLKTYFLPLVEGLLSMALDRVKRVQTAGCSAFATLEEEAGSAIAPYLGPILPQLVKAFETYQRRNMLVLYDVIGTMADSVGSELNRPEYTSVLLPPLMAKYQSFMDDDPDLIPLFECLSSVTISVGNGFAPYAPAVFQRCVRIIAGVMQRYQAGQVDFDWDDDRTFVVVSLDLLSGLMQGLQAEAQALVAAPGPAFMQLLVLCLTVPESSIRQSAYALLGDLAIFAFPQLRDSLPTIMNLAVEQIVPNPGQEMVSVCNNATWAVGEIALQYGPDPELKRYIPILIQKLVPVLLNQRSHKSLTENAAVTLGRLGLVTPEDVAGHLELFAEPWCTALWDIKDNDEKDSAFRGFCRMVELNPNGVSKSFGYFCMAIVRWQTPSKELNDQFIRILNGFKDMLGPEGWAAHKAQCPPIIGQRLESRYGL